MQPGVPALDAVDILAAHNAWIDRLKLCHGASRQDFDSGILDVVRRYASFVNMLPASSSNAFSEPGGLFRLGLETGFYSLQATDGVIVEGRSTITVRQQVEPRWRIATFVAGLCSEMHRSLSRMAVTDEALDTPWPCHEGGLTDWLKKRGRHRIVARWQADAQECRALGLFALPHIVPPAMMSYLGEGNSVVLPALLSAVSGVPLAREPSLMEKLVRQATALVIERELVAIAQREGKAPLGMHLHRHIVQAMQRLVAGNPAWLPNGERSRVWWSQEGMFVLWPNAATELLKQLETDGTPGAALTADSVVEVLRSEGIVVPRGDGTSLWRISPPSGKGPFDAIRIANGELLLTLCAEKPAAIEHSLLGKAVAAPQGDDASP